MASTDELKETKAKKTQPWKGICSHGCYKAKTSKRRCKCRCQGKLHGRAQFEREEKLRIAELEECCGQR